MTWFFIALIAPILWSLVNFADKFLLSEESENSSVGSLMIFSTFAGVIVVMFAPFFTTELFAISAINALILIVVGFLAALAIMLYLYALDAGETSVVVPFFQLIPVFAYFFAYVILGETLTTHQVIGAIVVVIGAAILSIEFHEEGGLRVRGKIALLMLGSSIIFALYETIFKVVAVDEGFIVSTFWEHVGLLLFGTILFVFFKKFRGDFLSLFRQKRKRVRILGINVGSEILTLAGNVFTNYALLLAPVALVLVVSSYQPVFVLIIGVLLTLFFPKIASEKLTAKHLLHKVFSLAVILIGTYMLFI